VCHGAIFLAGFLMIVSFQVARDYIASGDFSFGSQNLGVNLYLGNNPEAGGAFVCPRNFTSMQSGIDNDAKAVARGILNRDLKPSEVSMYWVSQTVRFIRAAPSRFLKLLAEKAKCMFSPEEFPVEHEFPLIDGKMRWVKMTPGILAGVLPFALLGFLLSLRSFRKTCLLFFAVATLALGMFVFIVTAKHRIAMIPFLGLYAGYGLVSCFEFFKKRSHTWRGLFILIIGAALFFSLFHRDHVKSSRQVSETQTVDFRLLKVDEDLMHSRYQDAIRELQLLEKKDPRNRFVLFKEGVAFYALGDYESAEKKLLGAISIFPYYVDAFYNLGVIYNLQGKYSQAEGVLRRAAFLGPDDAGIAFELGRTFKLTGRSEEAQREFRRALAHSNRWRAADIAMIRKELDEVSEGSRKNGKVI
jgi:tetratricopeptide (TPR) repeat protein